LFSVSSSKSFLTAGQQTCTCACWIESSYLFLRFPQLAVWNGIAYCMFRRWREQSGWASRFWDCALAWAPECITLFCKAYASSFDKGK